MAAESKDKQGPSTAVVAGSALLALGLVGLVAYFHYDARKAEEDLDRVKTQYREMVRMKKAIDEARRKGPAASAPAASTEDILSFLDKKRGQAGIAQSSFSVPSQQDVPLRGWKERAYTINLAGTRDAPVARSPVVDFLRLVEDERPSVRVKNLKLAFSGDSFSSVSITLSSFQRD